MKNKINKIIGIIIDIFTLGVILVFLGTVIYNLIMDQVYINKKVNKKYLTQTDHEIQISEVIAEKVYNAYIEKNKNKIDTFDSKSIEEINEIASKIKIDSEKVDAKALEIYKFADNVYKIKVEFKDENDKTWQMNGKKTMLLIKLDKKKETFKILDMEVGV